MQSSKLNIQPHNDDNNGWLHLLPELPPPNVLRGDQRFDYAVIGGGFTGLAASRRLAELQPEARIALIDAGRIGNNAAGRCSGFAIDQAHNIRATSFADAIDKEKEQIRLNRAGQAALRKAIEENAIDCDWRDVGKIHGAATQRGQGLLRDFASNLGLLGENCQFLTAEKMRETTGLSFYREGLLTPGTIQIQPAAMVRGLAETQPQNVTVFEDSPVVDIHYGDRHTLVTTEGKIETDTLVLANNSFGTTFGFYQQHIIPLLTYASMTRELSEHEIAALGGEDTWGIIPAHPFGSTVRRLRENRLLVRNIYAYSSGHNPTEAQRVWARQKHWQSFNRRFPMLAGVELEYTWGGALCLSGNGEPIFGMLRPRVFASLCHNGVGISRGTICGKLIAEEILGRRSELLEIMRSAGRPNKMLPVWMLRIGVPIHLASRRRQAGLEL